MRCNGMRETAERKKRVEQKANESTDRMGKGCRANEMEIIKSEMWIIKCWRIQWKQKGQLGQSIARCSPTLTKTSFHIIVMRDWRFSSKTILNRSNVWQCQRQRRWWFFFRWFEMKMNYVFLNRNDLRCKNAIRNVDFDETDFTKEVLRAEVLACLFANYT